MKPGFSLMDWTRLAANADISQGQFSTTRKITAKELLKHTNWMAIRGKVYDYSYYSPYHPGGPFELERGGGDDATSLFEEFHPWVNVDAMLKRSQVGLLIEPISWYPITVSSCETLNSQFYLVRLQVADQLLLNELVLAKKSVIYHVKLRAKMGPNKRYFERPYTPLIGPYLDPENLEEDNRQVISILLKKSQRKRRPAYLSHGLLDEAERLEFEIQIKPCLLEETWYYSAKSIGMVCAGSGITPALQIIAREIENKDSSRELFLVWCNQSEKYVDTEIEQRLEKLAVFLKGRLKIIHLFSRMDEAVDRSKLDFKQDFEVGRFEPEFLVKRPDALPPVPGEGKEQETSILICGPWEFENSVRGTMFLHGFPSKQLIRIPG